MNVKFSAVAPGGSSENCHGSVPALFLLGIGVDVFKRYLLPRRGRTKMMCFFFMLLCFGDVEVGDMTYIDI